MDTSSATELMASIDKLVEKNTFSLEALGAINDLRIKAGELAQQLTSEQRRHDTTANELRQVGAKLSACEAKNRDWEKREGELKTREATMVALEKDTAVAVAKQAATLDVMDRFLRNTIVRESIVSNVPVATPGSGTSMGYVSQHVGNETKTTVKE